MKTCRTCHHVQPAVNDLPSGFCYRFPEQMPPNGDTLTSCYPVMVSTNEPAAITATAGCIYLTYPFAARNSTRT
jgi:hypothetical protein